MIARLRLSITLTLRNPVGWHGIYSTVNNNLTSRTRHRPPLPIPPTQLPRSWFKMESTKQQTASQPDLLLERYPNPGEFNHRRTNVSLEESAAWSSG